MTPPMTFQYSTMPDHAAIPGFGGIDNTVRQVGSSPNVSIDSARTELFDVNADGLPDVLVTDPARYRTAEGAPAVGVFFNGFTGRDATPAAAGAFSDPVPVAIDGANSRILNLGNANLRTMDVDGNGRSDLLHMPRLDRYGWFTPTRNGDDAEVSPSHQDWAFSYQEVALDRPGDDPRIDFVRNGTHYQTFDVNGDGLIDVVRTTGTVMQTWLNLGWLPGRRGALWAGALLATAARSGTLSDRSHRDLPAPRRATRWTSADPEVRLADMNGDGIHRHRPDASAASSSTGRGGGTRSVGRGRGEL